MTANIFGVSFGIKSYTVYLIVLSKSCWPSRWSFGQVSAFRRKTRTKIKFSQERFSSSICSGVDFDSVDETTESNARRKI